MQRIAPCNWTTFLLPALTGLAGAANPQTQDTIIAMGADVTLAPHVAALGEMGLTLSAMPSGVGNGSIIALTVVGDHPYQMLAAKAPFAPNLVITGSAASVRCGELTLIGAEPGIGHDFTLIDQNNTTLFEATKR